MYGHSNTDTCSFSIDHLEIPGLVTPLLQSQAVGEQYFISPLPLTIPTYDMDSVNATRGGRYRYDSSGFTVSQTKKILRSESSHSITTQFDYNGCNKQPVLSPTELIDSELSSFTTLRKVFIAGDMQGANMIHNHLQRSESPLSNESNSSIESINKVCPYSPYERKERIGRYLSKKTQRNFTKKIKYACRKTLADSRPRIRGRFARNDEISTMEHQCTSQVGVREQVIEDEVDNWMNNFLDSFPPNFIP